MGNGRTTEGTGVGVGKKSGSSRLFYAIGGIIILALIFATATQLGGNSAPIAETPKTGTDQSGTGGGSGSGDSNPGGSGNVGASDDSDGVKVEGFNKVTLKLKDGENPILLMDKVKTVYVLVRNSDEKEKDIYFYAKKNDLSKLKMLSVKSLTLKNLRYEDTKNNERHILMDYDFPGGKIFTVSILVKQDMATLGGRNTPKSNLLSSTSTLVFIAETAVNEKLDEINPFYLIHIRV